MFKNRKDYADIEHVLNKLEPDEPVFILRAKDFHAPGAILDWAQAVTRNPQASREQFDIAANAVMQALAMLDWQQDNPDKVKLPDLPRPSEPDTN